MAGGAVKTASTLYNLNGVPLAVAGDLIDCPACGSEGVIECVQPRTPDRYNGKELALSDDLCICKCNPPPKLIADQNVKYQTLVIASLTSAEEMIPIRFTDDAAGRLPVEHRFDEQTQLVAPAIEGVPYFVETDDGRTFSGRVAADGILPRIETVGDASYTALWGDDALAKLQEREAL